MPLLPEGSVAISWIAKEKHRPGIPRAVPSQVNKLATVAGRRLA